MHERAGHSPHMYVLHTCFFSFPPIAREHLIIEEVTTVQGVHWINTFNTYVCTCTVDPHLSEHLGTEGWSDMRNVQITETGLNAL